MSDPLWLNVAMIYQLILASQSPRRRQLLMEAGYNPRVDTVKVSEIIEEKLNLRDALKKLARTKAEAYINSHKYLESQNILVLSADTVVVLQGRVLGKPRNNKEASEHLNDLSESMHSVMTSFCLYNLHSGESVADVVETLVQFKKLSESEIEDYIATGEPMDKAGSYAIQGKGGKFVVGYEGSWSNVVGLPMERLAELLKEKSWNVDRRASAEN